MDEQKPKKVKAEIVQSVHPGGRPTTYFPEYCEQLIDHMAQGYSFESFGGIVNAGRATLYQWMDKNPEFADAKKKGEAASKLFWERLQIRNAKSGEGNFSAISWALRNRFGQSSDKSTDTDPESAAKNQRLLAYDLYALKQAKNARHK